MCAPVRLPLPCCPRLPVSTTLRWRPLASSWPFLLSSAALHLPGHFTGAGIALAVRSASTAGDAIGAAVGKGVLRPGGCPLSWYQAKSARRHLSHHSCLHPPSSMRSPFIFSSILSQLDPHYSLTLSHLLPIKSLVTSPDVHSGLSAPTSIPSPSP